MIQTPLGIAFSIATAHDENLYRWVMLGTVLNVFEPAIKPTESALVVDLVSETSLRTEIDVTRTGRTSTHPVVGPGSHDEFLW